MENTQGCCAKKQQGQGRPEHTGTPQTSKWQQGPKFQAGPVLLPWGERCHWHRTLIIALQGQHRGGGWGCPASDLGFKGFSLGTFIPQCSPCHNPAVTQWGQGEDTGLDTDKLQSPALVLARSRMVAVPLAPLAPVVPRSCCPSMPAEARGTALLPTAGQLELLRGWHPLSSSLKPGPS